MKNTLVAFAAAASLGAAALAAPSPAAAGGCFGCAVGAGVAGGLIAGAIIGSAAAAPPVYYGPPPAYGPGCYYTPQRVWDPYWGAYRPGPRGWSVRKVAKTRRHPRFGCLNRQIGPGDRHRGLGSRAFWR